MDSFRTWGITLVYLDQKHVVKRYELQVSRQKISIDGVKCEPFWARANRYTGRIPRICYQGLSERKVKCWIWSQLVTVNSLVFLVQRVGWLATRQSSCQWHVVTESWTTPLLILTSDSEIGGRTVNCSCFAIDNEKQPLTLSCLSRRTWYDLCQSRYRKFTKEWSSGKLSWERLDRKHYDAKTNDQRSFSY